LLLVQNKLRTNLVALTNRAVNMELGLHGHLVLNLAVVV